jgi:type I restriction enzyme R subunit
MNIQPEQVLEDNLIAQLSKIGYERIKIKNESELLSNLKSQLEKHNKTTFSKEEFNKILNHLNKGNIFERAKILRDKMPLKRDDNSSFYVEFLNQIQWCKNEYQVTNQITIEGKYKNRYDVTILINGLPLVQIELKRRGLELKEAFNQINRYKKHSFWSDFGLFSYVQLFVISNGVNTKYFSNNNKIGFKQTFFWADEKNNLITNLDEFAEIFLEKCQLSKMICKYIVLHESNKLLMVLRPYQYYAVENLLKRVKNSHDNGYIWHTTGSGKTLTSFKSAQLLIELPKVFKVVFVVDRSDLDYQTTKEFNHFSDGSVNETDNTKNLIDQFLGKYKNKKKELKDSKLIITTIQKLNTAITKTKYLNQIDHLKDKRIIFIFDECHRSQFGDTHKRIKNFFNNAQMFGFTGTPIFVDNASKNQHGKRTTKDLFGDCLHRYLITNAISDGNVLKFSIEYWGKFKQKNGNLIDEEVKSINIKEVYEDEKRVEKNIDWIIQNHDKKTHNKYFSAILCVGSSDLLIKYYDIFQKKKLANEHNLRIATIFTYQANEDPKNDDGLIPADNFDISKDNDKHSRDKLDEFIKDYNQLYKTSFSTDSEQFYNYYRDIGKKLNEREKENFNDANRIDILLVVNMFLTGFDAKKVNTLYVDKNLKNHGLIQAFSRTNRILNEIKSHGNIICFRNLKDATDKAVKLFSDENAKETIIMEPYEDYLDKFNEAIKILKDITPNVNDVDNLISENEILIFVKSFRNLMRLKNILQGFADFTFEDLDIGQQEYEDYKTKYLDINDKVKKDEDDSVSILNDVDFELELITKDEINVDYILELVSDIYNDDNSSKDNIEKKKQDILNIISGESNLRSKKELIENFIENNLPKIKQKKDIKTNFDQYWNQEKEKALAKIRDEENMIEGNLKPIIENYIFSGIEPSRNEMIGAITKDKRPKILERKKVATRIMSKIKEFINIFED